MIEYQEEGWYTDPFARHELRWMSDGKPTKLVRDQERECYDDVPDGPFIRTPVAVEYPKVRDGSDLRRADDAQAVPSGGRSDPPMMAWDVVWSDGAPLDLLNLEAEE